MENRKNTVLLTVIAIATLLVAVVGATFAFFSVQGGTTATKTITVQTHTTDSTTFEIAGNLSIDADQTNFFEGAGNKYTGTTASVDFTAADQESEGLCYTFTMDLESNTFGYSASNTSNTPELTLDVVKGGTLATTPASCSDENGTTREACLAITGATWTPEVMSITTDANSVAVVNNQDITTLDATTNAVAASCSVAAGNASSEACATEGGTWTPAHVTYYIGNTANGSLSTSEVKHELSATTTETYAVLITFHNLATDQTDKAGEALSAKLHLKKVVCD